MNVALRLFIGLIVGILLFIGVIKYADIRPDQYLPPTAPLVINDMILRGPGTITSVDERGYGDHWWAGVDFRWYIDYTFTPKVPNKPDDGTFVPGVKQYNGSVQITQYDYMNTYKVGDNITVSYNPYNPIVNGVHGTLGGIGTTATFFSGWLWYPVGIVLTAILVGEFMKRWIKTGDI